jgi:hypothetical protein
LTLKSNDFFGLAAGFREASFRGAAFFATRALDTAVFFLAAGLDLELTRLFAAFRVAALCGAARLAFGRLAFGATRRLAGDFDEDRRADARDVERLSPFETALMRLQIEGLMRVNVSRRCGGRLT